MSQIHIVKQGECLSSIADAYGLKSWRVIYDDPHNADFKAKRPNPNLIYPGDELYIPGISPKDESVATDQRHIFTATFPPTYLNLRIQDQDDQAFANARYSLAVGPVNLEGTTDDDGWIHSLIPPWAELGNLKVWPVDGDEDTVIQWQMKLGHLNPIETVSGIKGRLNNLGYECGEINDDEDDDYTAAVMQFQGDNGLVVDGIVGPITRGALLKQHQV